MIGRLPRRSGAVRAAGRRRSWYSADRRATWRRPRARSWRFPSARGGDGDGERLLEYHLSRTKGHSRKLLTLPATSVLRFGLYAFDKCKNCCSGAALAAKGGGPRRTVRG